MKTTLNLRLDKEIIEDAKKYDSKSQWSLSEIVETYLKKLKQENRKPV